MSQDYIDAVRLQVIFEQQSNAADSSSFNQLLDVHYIKDRVSEALLVLEANSRIIERLNGEYKRAWSYVAAKEGETGQLKDTLLDFDGRISNIVQELKMQISRAKSLVQLVDDRKTLVSSHEYTDSTFLMREALTSLAANGDPRASQYGSEHVFL